MRFSPKKIQKKTLKDSQKREKSLKSVEKSVIAVYRYSSLYIVMHYASKRSAQRVIVIVES